MRILLAALVLVMFGSSAQAQDFTGRFTSTLPTGTASLEVVAGDGEAVTGAFSLNGYTMQLVGAVDPETAALSGTLTSDIERLGFAGQWQGETLAFSIFGYDTWGQPNYATAQTLGMQRVSGEVQPGVPAQAVSPGVVVINRIELSADRLQAIESSYRTTIPPGRYWYDSACGGWGVEGGPTLGFVAAGLDLPGPLPPDISGSGTGIFINGREIHLMDQTALASLLGVTYPGRYTLDASGNLSVEGGAFLVNLVQASRASQQSSGQRGGMYSGMGGTVGVADTGEALFYTPSGSGFKNWTN